MAPPRKIKEVCSCTNEMKPLVAELAKLKEAVADLLVRISTLERPRVASSIQRTETFNGEFAPAREESNVNKFSHEEKIQNMRNAAVILPPNLIKDGRHSLENINALMCFPATEEMMDELYSQYSHSPE